MKNLIFLLFCLGLTSLSAQDLLSDLIQTRKWKSDTYLTSKGDAFDISILAIPAKDEKPGLPIKPVTIDQEEYNLLITDGALFLKNKEGETILKTNGARNKLYDTDNQLYKKKSKLWLKKELAYYNEAGELIVNSKLRGRRIEIDMNETDPNAPLIAAIAFEEMLQYARTFYALGGDWPVVVVMP